MGSSRCHPGSLGARGVGGNLQVGARRRGEANGFTTNSHPSLTRILLGVSSAQHTRLQGEPLAEQRHGRWQLSARGDCCHLDPGVGHRAKVQATKSFFLKAL